MHTINRTTSTTDMEVTSIRLERELKERLKELADKQGYQALIRDILWDYVQRKSGDSRPSLSKADIRISMAAIAEREEICYLTGQAIAPHEPMLLGLTTSGDLVPLSPNSLQTSH
jgi:metal-responsive CopG/Arc/MetJ family transcriptional regulator